MFDFINKKPKLIKALVLLIFLIFSLIAVFSWIPDLIEYSVIGNGDYLAPLNIVENFAQKFFVHDFRIYGGLNTAFEIAHIFPYYFFFYSLNLMGSSPLTATLFLMALISFVSCVSFFYYTFYLIEDSEYDFAQKVFLAFAFAIFYGFSPFIIGLVTPGHVALLFSYAVYPLLIWSIDEFLENPDKITSASSISRIVLFSLFSASSFANVGIVYVIALSLVFYSIVKVAVNRLPIINLIKAGVAFIILFISSNFYWLVPYLINFKAHYIMNVKSNPFGSIRGVEIASQFANIANVFLFRAEGILHTYHQLYLSKTFLFITVVFFAIFLTGLYIYRKEKKFLVFLLVLISAIFITKGTQRPFHQVFVLMYENIPGFGIFRRPVSKYYWVFFFNYFSILVLSVRFFIKKNKYTKIFLNMFLAIAALIFIEFFAYSYSNNDRLITFNIPEYYYETRTYLNNDDSRRVLLIPTNNGWKPDFSEPLNYYNGTDFIRFIWSQSVLQPDKTNITPELPYKNKMNKLYENLSLSESFCSEAKELGVDHIVIRHDLREKRYQSAVFLKRILDKSPEVLSVKYFGGNDYGLSVYKVSAECNESIITGLSKNNTDVIQPQITQITPTMFYFTFKEPVSKIEFKENYASGWKLYTVSSEDNFHLSEWDASEFLNSIETELNLFSKREKIVGEKTKSDYMNSWKLPSDINEKTFVVYFYPQVFTYVSFAVNIIFIGLFLAYVKFTNR